MEHGKALARPFPLRPIMHKWEQFSVCLDRTADWGAPRCSLSGVAVPGQTYTFSAYAMFADGNDYQNMALKLLYTDSSGKDQHKDIKNVKAKHQPVLLH